MGRYIRLVFRYFGIKRDLQRLLSRKRRQQLFNIDVEAETERILKDIEEKENAKIRICEGEQQRTKP